jgi:hypothetical protein
MLKRTIRLFCGRAFHDRLFAHELSPERASFLVKAGVASILGRTVVCHSCGKKVAKILPVVRSGRVELWGMHQSIVRVEFADRNSLRFTHVLPENCEALRDHDRS